MVRRSAMLWPEGSPLFSMGVRLHRCTLATAKNNLEAEPQRFRWNCRLPVKNRNEPVASLLIFGAIENGIEGNQRIARKIHLRHKTCRERRTKKRKMNMRRPPRIVMISPGIFSRTNGYESVAAFRIRHGKPATREIRIERCIVLIVAMEIASGCIGLPDFDKRVRHRPRIFVENAPAHDNALPERYTGMLLR